MKVIDNISTLLKDELIENIKKGSKMTIAASCFSMYAYKELKKTARQYRGTPLHIHLTDVCKGISEKREA